MREMQDVPTSLTDTPRSFTTLSLRQVSIPVALILAAGFVSVTGCNRGHSADVVATVNGHAIMRTDLNKRYQAQLGDSPQQRQLPQEQADSLRLNVLHELIDEEIVKQRIGAWRFPGDHSMRPGSGLARHDLRAPAG